MKKKEFSTESKANLTIGALRNYETMAEVAT